ncbi:winged helix-turn-helix domain-containing protein [Magnetococcales bacterium HHB-1]
MRLLLVEGEFSEARNLKKGFEEERFAVDCAPNGEEAIYLASNCPYDSIVIELPLPDMDGLELLKSIREHVTAPIMILAMDSDVDERIDSIRGGADDYLVKPIFKELLVRIRALIRRSGGRTDNILLIDNLKMDLNRHWVFRGEENITLTSKEFSLLEYLMHHQDRVVSRTELIEHLYDETFDRDSNLIDVFIHKIRRKVDLSPQRKLIHTIRGTGYILSAQR